MHSKLCTGSTPRRLHARLVAAKCGACCCSHRQCTGSWRAAANGQVTRCQNAVKAVVVAPDVGASQHRPSGLRTIIFQAIRSATEAIPRRRLLCGAALEERFMASETTAVANAGGSRRWDYGGVTASVLCIVHCIAMPLLVGFAPVLAATEHETHIGLTAGLFLIGLLAFLPGYREHRRIRPVLIAVSGFAMLVSAALLPSGVTSEFWEPALTVTGGLLLITAHLGNVYYCRRCRSCGSTPCRALVAHD